MSEIQKSRLVEVLDRIHHEGRMAGIRAKNTDAVACYFCPEIWGTFRSLAWKRGFRETTQYAAPILNAIGTPGY